MMSKKSAIILILAVFISSLGALIWFYFSYTTVSKPPAKITTTADTYDPFGTVASNSGNSFPTTDINTTVSTSTNMAPVAKIRQISVDPVSGFSVFTDKDGKTITHYILRSNGNIYEAYDDSSELKRLSNTTVPKVYESSWLPDGQRLILRYLRDETENIVSFSVKINPATTTINEFEGGIDGNFLPDNISSLSVNPAGDKIFYLTSNLNGSSGFVSQPNGLSKKLIFESPLIEWAVSWPKEEIITMTTKPASTIPGYLYFLNSKTGSFSKILGNIRGLTTKTNAAASLVLYSDSARNTPRLYLFNIKTGDSKLLPWSTFPEKCLWSSTDSKTIYCAVPKTFEAGSYPDLWYQGLTNFTDDIWMLNTDTGASALIADLQKETNKNIDAIDVQIDKKDRYLFFTNKIDLTLWSVGLK